MNQKQRGAPIASSWDGFLPKNAIVMATSRVVAVPKEDFVSQVKLVFLWKNPSISSDARALLEKMVQAMGLKMDDVFVAHAAQEIPASCQVLVVLGDGQFEGRDPITVLNTHDPEMLIKNPALKKETWATLLKVADLLGLAVPKR